MPVRTPSAVNVLPDFVAVRYIGSANSYTFGKYRFTKKDPILKVPKQLWLDHLRRQRTEHTGLRLFMMNNEGFVDREIQRQEMRTAKPGSYITKAGVAAYARDLFDVELDGKLSIKELNEQVVELKRRYDHGVRGWRLIHNLPGARPVPDAPDFVAEEEINEFDADQLGQEQQAEPGEDTSLEEGAPSQEPGEGVQDEVEHAEGQLDEEDDDPDGKKLPGSVGKPRSSRPSASVDEVLAHAQRTAPKGKKITVASAPNVQRIG